jgi:hypothetical protein
MNRLIMITMLAFVPVSLFSQIGWTEHTVDGDFDYAISVYAADVDGDGDMDVLGAAYTADDVSWWENIDGLGTIWIEHPVDTNFAHAMSVYAADVDGDEDMDILSTAGYNDRDITWWENINGSGTSWTEHTVDDYFDGRTIYAADVNGDNYMDILGASSTDDDITWWENTDSIGTSWTEHIVDGTYDGAMSVYAAYVNDDQYLDILGAAWNADDITWWENNDGSGTSWTEHLVDGNFDAAWSVYAADINDDGYMDIIGAARDANTITWWENTDGTGTNWVAHDVDSDFNSVRSVYAADIDKDDDLDILGAAQDADDITWWENADDTGFVWIEHPIDSTFDGARSAYAADIDGDSDIDILGAAINDDDITWWESNLVIKDVGFTTTYIETLIPEGESFSPQATVKNFGTNPESFPVTCIIEPGSYSSTDYVSVAPGDSVLIIFWPSFPLVSGDYIVTFFTQLIGDQNPSNDTMVIVIHTYDPGIAEDGSTVPEALVFKVPTINRRKADIEFSLPVTTQVDLVVYDAIGRLLQMLVSRRFKAGIHTVTIDLDLPTGVYFYRLKTDVGSDIVQKFLLIE